MPDSRAMILDLIERMKSDPYASGVTATPPSEQAYTLDPPVMPRAPASFTLPSYRKVPVFSQQGGTCVGNSLAAAMTHLQFIETGEVPQFSGEEINARVTHKEGEATSFGAAMDMVVKGGVDSGQGLYFPKGYANVDYRDAGAMKDAISTPGQALVLATWLPDGWDSNPLVFRQAAPQNSGGLHAMLIVGYTPEGVIVQNSWDTWWGDGGFIRLAWSFVHAHCVEVMAITDQSDVLGGYVKTYEPPDMGRERAVRHVNHPDGRKRPAVYLVKGNGRIWITDIWQARRMGVNLHTVEQLPDTDKVWALPVIGPDAPREQR